MLVSSDKQLRRCIVFNVSSVKLRKISFDAFICTILVGQKFDCLTRGTLVTPTVLTISSRVFTEHSGPLVCAIPPLLLCLKKNLLRGRLEPL